MTGKKKKEKDKRMLGCFIFKEPLFKGSIGFSAHLLLTKLENIALTIITTRFIIINIHNNPPIITTPLLLSPL
jgi:hypothetical protein